MAMKILEEKIVEKLKSIIDPASTLDVISLGLVRNLKITDKNSVSLELKSSSPVCPLIYSLAFAIQNSLRGLEEIENLNIKVIDHQMADDVNRSLIINKA